MGFKDYFAAKEAKLRADNRFIMEYAQIGLNIFEILNKMSRPFLDRIDEFSEVANQLPMSTYRQFVYSIKLNRALTDDERYWLRKNICKELAQIYKVDFTIFVKSYDVKIVGNCIFYIVK